MKRQTKFFLAAALGVAAAASVVVTIIILAGGRDLTVPGFARLSENGDERVYVTPEGFYFRVHREDNYPVKDLRFWRDALAAKMDKSGYTRLFEDRLSAGRRAGCYFEWGAPYGNEDYVYVTALLLEGDTLLVGEAAGEISLFSPYRPAIMEAMLNLARR
jgi:hypothetical protein